jgi:hypothetical protein
MEGRGRINLRKTNIKSGPSPQIKFIKIIINGRTPFI